MFPGEGEEQDSSIPLSKLSSHTMNVLLVGRNFSAACGFVTAAMS